VYVIGRRYFDQVHGSDWIELELVKIGSTVHLTLRRAGTNLK